MLVSRIVLLSVGKDFTNEYVHFFLYNRILYDIDKQKNIVDRNNLTMYKENAGTYFYILQITYN